VVALTGATGFLGKEIARTLAEDGFAVRAIARREPPSWERIPGVTYHVADLGNPLPASLFQGVETVVHAAAETAGGFEEHQRNSINATEHVLRAAKEAGVKRVLNVSSLAVLAGGAVINDETPLEPNSKGSGPYVWGKLESERVATSLGEQLGVSVKTVRPGAIVDYRDFDPPGRLGKRLGNVFVAVGAPSHKLGVVDLSFTARTIRWFVRNWDEAPKAINLLAPELPTKRDLLNELRRSNPDLSVVWLPTVILVPLSWMALLAQKVLRPGKPAINVAKVFAAQRYDTGRISALAGQIEQTSTRRA
jgi:nucleoside-diphosphate-sugar epimerase